MDFVCVDLGASGTRYTSDKAEITTLPNNIVQLNTGEVTTLRPDAPDIESCLEVTITRKGEPLENDFFPCTVLMGQMATRYSSNNDRPSGMSNKYTQRINYVSAIVSAALARLKFGTSEDIDLYIAVPPVEINLAREAFSTKLTGKFVVTIPKYMGGATINLNINSVSVHEESYMSTVSFLFNMNGSLKEDNKKYLVGKMLSIDIGASTTDFAIVQNGKFLDKSGRTIKTGGNVARDVVIDKIRELYGFDLPVEDAENVMAEGRLQLGAEYVDVTDIVNKGKSELAKSIVNEMQSYFRSVNIPLQTINCMMVSGGGSMQSQYINDDKEVVKTASPMSEFVTEWLQSVCKTVPVVTYGDDARLANIRGLFIKAMLDSTLNKSADSTKK